jgi:hypothetical protein
MRNGCLRALDKLGVPFINRGDSGRIKSTPNHICGLRSFRTWTNLKFNGGPFIRDLVSLTDSCVVDKYIRTVTAPIGVVEPFDESLH